MFQLPKLPATKQKKQKYMYAFGGINKTEKFSVGELETSNGICFDNFPAIGARRKRIQAEGELKPSDTNTEYLFYANGLIRVYGISRQVTDANGNATEDGGYITLSCITQYLKEEEGANWGTIGILKKTWLEDDAPEEGRKIEIVAINNYVVAFPFKKYMDTSKTTPSWKDMEVSYESESETYYVSHDHIRLNYTQYSAFTALFREGDAVDFRGGFYDDNDGVWRSGMKIIRRFETDSDSTHSYKYYIYFDAHSFEGARDDDNYFGIYERKIPDLTNICEWNGRLWGIDEEGNICASKYADPLNFEYFDFTDSDSYEIEVSTPGKFTAVTSALSGQITFFKENKIHRITGTKPSNYRLSVFDLSGVKTGSENSVAVIDDILYYETTDGIYIYDGSRTKKISEALGNIEHSGGVAGADKKRYFISLKTGDEEYTLYCYDAEKGTWLRDGEEQMVKTCCYLGKLIYLTPEGTIKTFETEKEDKNNFSVTLREITEDFSEQKGFSRLYLCYSMRNGGNISVEVAYGVGGSFKKVGIITDHKKCISEIRLEPNRSDYIRIRLTATPDVIIKNLMREYYTHGS